MGAFCEGTGGDRDSHRPLKKQTALNRKAHPSPRGVLWDFNGLHKLRVFRPMKVRAFQGSSGASCSESPRSTAMIVGKMSNQEAVVFQESGGKVFRDP